MFSRWDYREYRRWRRRRRRRFAALLSIAFLLVAVAAVHATGIHTGHATTAHAVHPGFSATRHRSAKRDRYLRSDHPHGTPGTGLSWMNFHGIELPVSVQDGPHHMRNGLAWGFTDTPNGALLAAVNIVVRTAALWGPAIYQPTIRYQVTGPGTAALLAADASDYAALRSATRAGPGQPAGRGYAAEAGFRIAAYTPAGATIGVATEGPGTGSSTVMVATRIEVVWRHGDWRVLAPPGGDWARAATVLSSLTGYTPFANQG